MREVTGIAAFVLHQHDWQDNGRIFELLTREHGRISVFAQGVRGPKARLAAVMQPFVPLLVSWVGRGEAPRLIGAEFAPQAHELGALVPQRLMSAWYLNELLLNLTLRHDALPEVHDHYAQALQGLRSSAPLERELRLFEKRLLDVLGYGIPLRREGQQADPLGLERISPQALQCLAEENLDDAAVVEELRPLLRRALALCLDGRSLRTRQVARSMADLRRGALNSG
jgi:DNA repair protein RecO (recombination protein O)